MPKSEVSPLTLVAVLIALGLSGTIAPGMSVFGQLLAGAVLLILVLAYDREGYRTTWQCLAFGAVAGACVTRIIIIGLQLAGMSVEPGVAFTVSGTPPSQPAQANVFPWTPVVWIIATLALWGIDMSRMQKRAAMQGYAAAPVMPPPVPMMTQPAPVMPQPAPVMTRPPVREEPVRVQAPASMPPPSPSLSARHTGVTSLFSQAPITRDPEPMPRPAPPVEQVVAPAPAAATPIFEAPAAPIAPPIPVPQAVPVPRGSGKPVTIYLNLVGEGLPVMRSVQAEHVGKDYYMIVESMPAGETWQFTTGQVVRCQKRNLSNGKGLVAVEEAPRAS